MTFLVIFLVDVKLDLLAHSIISDIFIIIVILINFSIFDYQNELIQLKIESIGTFLSNRSQGFKLTYLNLKIFGLCIILERHLNRPHIVRIV